MRQKLDKFESREYKVNKVSPILFNLRLIVTSVFCLIALTLYLLNYLHFPVLCLIVFGAIWNFFVDINTFLAFLLSLIVGVLFSMLAIIDGLYVNAMLYIFFYIPLQFVTWLVNPKEKDMSIKKDKKLSGDNIYYISIIMILTFAICFAIVININHEIFHVLDTIVACMLGLSAFLQSYMYREFYVVRIASLVLSIVLWAFVLYTNVFSMGAIGIILLYSMYLILDILAYVFWIKSSLSYDKEAVEEIDQKGNKKLIQEKVEEYNKSIKDVKSFYIDDGGIDA